MRLGIIGLPGSGKTAVFEALTRNISDAPGKHEDRIGTIPVPDQRVDVLSDMYKPQKTIHAQVEYFLPGISSQAADKDQPVWAKARDCDALIHVVRNFTGYGLEPPNPQKDYLILEQELIIADLVVVEKRLERLELDRKRGKKINHEEWMLLQKSHDFLENEDPLRHHSEIALAKILRGFGLLSAKPELVLFNNDDDNIDPPTGSQVSGGEESMVIRAKLEQEIAQMTEEEAGAFLAEFEIQISAMDRVIKQSYSLLGLISFFTIGKDEVRAWTIRKGTNAPDAAGAIHTDFKKGFIRAEVLRFDDLIDAGSFAEARKKGTVRLEGKSYVVKDGDIINFRFNV